MGIATVQPLKLSDPSSLRKIRGIAADSNRVILTAHAKKRMKERRVSFKQVLECLLKGVISEPAHLNAEGDWIATLKHQCAGDVVKVAVAIERQENGDVAVVVTVMN